MRMHIFETICFADMVAPYADLTEPIDIYSEWIDAADDAEKTLG